MATSFPTGLDALTNPTGASSLTSPDHAGQHADANDAIEALEAKVGVNGSAVTSSLDYKITNINASNLASGTVPSARVAGAYTGVTSVGTLSALRVDGNVGIGISGLPQTGLRFGKDIGGSAFSQGIFLGGAIQPSVTTRADMIWTAPTVAASVTLPTLQQFYASVAGVGAGSTITASTGFYAESNIGSNDLGTITNAYGFLGNLASGTGRWNLYMQGTAANYLQGRLGVGGALTSGAMAMVLNTTTAADDVLILKGAASQSGDFFDIQNSGGTSQFRVDSAGNLFVASNAITGDAKTKIGWGRSGNGYSYIDLIGDATYTDYGFRVIRNSSGANASTELAHRGTGNFALITQEAAPIVFSTSVNASGGERMRIDSAGFVGIGTSTPTVRLEVSGSTTISSQTHVAATFGSGTSGRLLVGSITANTPFIGSEGASNLLFYTNAVERMRITSAGNIGIGNSGGGDTGVSIGTNITGATTAYGIRSLQTIQSGVTASAFIFSSQPSTVASAFTVADLVHFRANSTTIGSTSAVTNQYGFSAGANLTGATGFNIGFHGNIGAGTNRYNIYMDGTANNHLAGRLGVGVNLTSGAMAQITNTTAGDKAFVVRGHATQSVSLLEVQNSSGTALVTINSAGKVGIGNTAPENTLDITGSFGRGNPVAKTANFTLAGTENWIICNGAGTITMTLPTPSDFDGRELGIKTVSPQLVNSASANVIAIGGGAAGTAILPATSGAWAILVSDGANWHTMCRGT